MTHAERTRLVVLFGGQSPEHDVSRVTAAHVARAADPERYEVVPVAITPTGRWVLAEAAAAALAEAPGALPDALEADGPALSIEQALAGGPGAGDRAPRPVVVFPLVHGPFGEDGTLQGLLELAGVPYVGSGVLGSAVAMDKSVAKELLSRHGIPVARWHTARASESVRAVVDVVTRSFELPVFVKPANMGSSIGVRRAATTGELRDAVDHARRFDEVILVEEAVAGREIEVAVLGDEWPRASLAGEVVPSAEFYDYADKYLDGQAELRIPAPLTAAQADTVRTMALRVFAVLRSSGMARVDFFFEEGGRGFLCNELNTIPGFTPHSMYPRLWQASGVSYPSLIDELVELARRRHERRLRRTDRD